MGEQRGSAAEHQQPWLPAAVMLLEHGLANTGCPSEAAEVPKGMPEAVQVLLRQPGCCSRPKAAAQCDACSPQRPGWQGLAHCGPNTTIRSEPSSARGRALAFVQEQRF